MANLELKHFTQQPAWLRDNHYLHNNHRAPTASYLVCLRSCFMLHTETMNIWLVRWHIDKFFNPSRIVTSLTKFSHSPHYHAHRTHLLPCFLFVFLIIKTIDSANLTVTDKIVINLFLLGAFLCHMFSTAFHAFSCHSEKVGKFFQK
jgi:adiponectin receptor